MFFFVLHSKFYFHPAQIGDASISLASVQVDAALYSGSPRLKKHVVTSIQFQHNQRKGLPAVYFSRVFVRVEVFALAFKSQFPDKIAGERAE